MKRKCFTLCIIIFALLVASCSSFLKEQKSYLREISKNYLDSETEKKAKEKYDKDLKECQDVCLKENYGPILVCTSDLEDALYRARIHHFPIEPVAEQLYTSYMCLASAIPLTPKLADLETSLNCVKVQYLPWGRADEKLVTSNTCYDETRKSGPLFTDPGLSSLRAMEVAQRYELGKEKVQQAANYAIDYYLTLSNRGGYYARSLVFIALEAGISTEKACRGVKRDSRWHQKLEGDDLKVLDECGVPLENRPEVKLRRASKEYIDLYSNNWKTLSSYSSARLSKYVEAERALCETDMRIYCGDVENTMECHSDDIDHRIVFAECSVPLLLQIAVSTDDGKRHEFATEAFEGFLRDIKHFKAKQDPSDQSFAIELGKIATLIAKIELSDKEVQQVQNILK